MNIRKILSAPVLAVALFAAVRPSSAQTLSQEIAAPIAASAATAVPALVPYAGAAIGVSGKPLTGDTAATFLIYKDQTGGEPLFAETQTVPIDLTGHYKVQLGATNPNGLPTSLFASGEARWLEVQIAGEGAQPRVLLASVPYALKAADAATLGGLPASAFALAGSTAGFANAASATVTSDTTTGVTTTGGTANKVAKFSSGTTIVNSLLYDNGTQVGVNTTTPTATLTVGGTMTVNGATTQNGDLLLAPYGTATSSAGYLSHALKLNASAYNSSTKAVVSPRFQLQTEIFGNDTSTPGGRLNLLASSGPAGIAETGLYFNTDGSIHFAAAQTFPGGPGSGTISGVTAGTGLTGGGTTGVVTLKVDTTKVPLLAASNKFVGNQTVTGDQYVSGNIGVGTTGPDAPIDIENTTAGQLILLSAGPGAWAINSFGGNNEGLAGRFVGGYGGSNGGGEGISVAGGSTSDSTPGGYGASIYGGSSYTGAGGDGLDVTAGNYGDLSQGYAAEFTGNVYISGSLNASAKNFRIDHPLDPANRYLNHASTESSEMMNIYSGNVTTDGSGLSTVALPDWFEVINTDFRYQLTVVGQFAQAIIKSKIAGGHFTIMTNAPNVEVSWMITAVRQDPYAKAHPLTVEQEKPANEKGFYIHPELYDQPSTKQTGWGRHPQQMQHMKDSRAARQPVLKADESQQP